MRRWLAVMTLASGLTGFGATWVSPAVAQADVAISSQELLWAPIAGPQPNQPVIEDSVAAWDPSIGHAVLYTGSSAVRSPDTTWVLRDTSWQSAQVPAEPHVDPIGMVFDTDQGNLILIGVDPSAPGQSETWKFDGRSWTQLTGTGPPPLTGAAVSYDETTSKVVLFGGLAGGKPANQTWTFDGTKWSNVALAVAPSPRAHAAMAWDEGADGLRLFGGTSNSSAGMGDTWVFSHDHWTREHVPAPFAPGRYQMLTDAQQALLLGRSWDGTWNEAIWDAATAGWQKLQPPYPGPPPVAAFLAFYDPSQQQVEAYGGADETSDPGLWAAQGTTQPQTPCAIVVSGGFAKTSATFASLRSSYGVELDAEKLSDGTAKVTLVAVSQKGIDLLIGYDGEVDKTGSGESGAAGGQAGQANEGGAGQASPSAGGTRWSLSEGIQAAVQDATGWEWDFQTIADAQAFINGPAAKWTQHNLVQVIPVIGQWIADHTGQVQLPPPGASYVTSGYAAELAASAQQGPVGGGLSGDLAGLTGGGLTYDQASHLITGSTVDFALSHSLAGDFGVSFGNKAGTSLGGGASGMISNDLTGEVKLNTAGVATEFTLTNKVQGALSGVALGNFWDNNLGVRGVVNKAGLSIDQSVGGYATEDRLTLPLQNNATFTVDGRQLTSAQAVQDLIDALNKPGGMAQAQAAHVIKQLADQEGTDTVLTYHQVTSGSSIGGETGDVLAYGASGNYGNTLDTLKAALFWDPATHKYTPWTACLASLAPTQPVMVPPSWGASPSLGVTLGQLAGLFANARGYGEVEPSQINNGGDPTGVVTQISWRSWGGSKATASGVGDYVAPGQSVATGAQEPVTIVAFNLGSCDGKRMYQAVEWYFPQHGQTFDPNQYENICAGTYVQNTAVPSAPPSSSSPAGPGYGTPQDAADGLYQAELQGDWAAACSYVTPDIQSLCQDVTSGYPAATGRVTVRGAVTNRNLALAEVTGSICLASNGCSSNFDPAAGMPGGSASFQQVYDKLVASSASILSPVPCVKIGGKWYVKVVP